MTTQSKKVTATPGMGNLFAKATATKTAAKKTDDKEVVKVTDPAISTAINEYEKAKSDEKKAIAAKQKAEKVIKEYGDKIFIAEMEKSGRRKESFLLSNDTNSLLFLVQDSYKRSNLDADRICYLRELFGDEIVNEETKFIFNAEMVEKHGEQISLALSATKVTLADGQTFDINIPDADRALIISKEVKPVIAKGTIEKLREIVEAANKKAGKIVTTVVALFQEIQPTRQLKVRGEK